MKIGTKVATGGGVGSAFGVLFVVGSQIIWPDTMTADQGAILTGALGTIAGFIIRYLPAPAQGGGL